MIASVTTLAVRFVTVAVLCAQTTATAPATSQPIDLSSPRSAAKSLRAAVQRDSLDEALDCIFTANSDQRALATAHVRLIIATKKLADAIESRFGGSADMLTAGALKPQDMQGVESARITMRGENAAIMQLRGSERPLPLRRGDDGLWRVDLLAFAGSEPAEAAHIPQQVALLEELSEFIGEVDADVQRGRFNAVGDVRAALQDRVHGAVARSLRRDQPATHPASQPATTPTSRPS